jgi:inosine-uridine nucleoside N-ribohydrolase
MNLHFDMETSDPDDVMTLAILATHPRGALRGVTIAPGGQDQIDLVRHVLAHLGRDDVRVGAGRPKADKPNVSPFHYEWLGTPPATGPAEPAVEVLGATFSRWPDAVLLTGAKLTNVASFLEADPSGPPISTWVGQGGFAGDDVVPAEHRLEKFAGRNTSPTFNFNADPKAALSMLTSPRLRSRYLVSKNVCHRIAWDHAFHERMRRVEKPTAGLSLCIDGMRLNLQQWPSGKILHDPLAAMTALDRSICVFGEVAVYRLKGEWGSRLSPGSGTHISIAANDESFARILSES